MIKFMTAVVQVPEYSWIGSYLRPNLIIYKAYATS